LRSPGRGLQACPFETCRDAHHAPNAAGYVSFFCRYPCCRHRNAIGGSGPSRTETSRTGNAARLAALGFLRDKILRGLGGRVSATDNFRVIKPKDSLAAT
jgi:hypothetical protein